MRGDPSSGRRGRPCASVASGIITCGFAVGRLALIVPDLPLIGQAPSVYRAPTHLNPM